MCASIELGVCMCMVLRAAYWCDGAVKPSHLPTAHPYPCLGSKRSCFYSYFCGEGDVVSLTGKSQKLKHVSSHLLFVGSPPFAE